MRTFKLKQWLLLSTALLFGLGVMVALIGYEQEASPPPEKIIISKQKPAPTIIEENKNNILAKEKFLAPLEFNWIAGKKQTYQYSFLSKIETNTNLFEASSEAWQTANAELTGVLNARFFEARPEKFYVGFQLSPIQFSIAKQRLSPLENLYSSFFMVAFSKDGQPIEFHVPQKIHASEKKLVTEIINGIQLILPSSVIKKEWVTRENNITGEYTAEHTLQENKISKKKISYLTISSFSEEVDNTKTLDFKGNILTSHTEGIISKKQAWIESLVSKEHLEINSQQGKVAKITSQISLHLSDDLINPELAIWQANSDPDIVIAGFANSSENNISAWDELEQQQLRDKFANVKISDLTRQIIDLNLQGKSIQELIPHLKDLENYLSVYPESSADIPELLHEPNLSKAATGGIINALEVVGHHEAQQALTEIMLDEAPTNPQVSYQSLVAAGGIKEPIPDLINGVWHVSEQENEHMDMALLALGSAGANLEKTGNSVDAAQIRNNLVENLHNETEDSYKQKLILVALKNTKNTDLFETVSPYLEAENEEVREAAYSVLENSNDNTSFNKLLDSVEQDDSPAVRQTAVKAISTREDSSLATAAISQYISQEPEAAVRKEMIQFLGQHKLESPEIVDALKQQLSVETSTEMIKEIYTVLYEKTEKKPINFNKL